jgi:CheY-like chemotaxis protein
MKTEKELNQDILEATMQIAKRYPELSKYIGEMPFKSSSLAGHDMDVQNLEDYYNSLTSLLKSYAPSHLKILPNQSERKTILLIEDNIAILENLTEFMELEGYKIITAKNGKNGVEMAMRFHPDLIICDVLMAGMNGFKVLHLLLDTVKTFDIPFIFSSSMAEKYDRESALKLGADDYIVKPFDPEELLVLVKAHMKSGSIRQKTLNMYI